MVDEDVYCDDCRFRKHNGETRYCCIHPVSVTSGENGAFNAPTLREARGPQGDCGPQADLKEHAASTEEYPHA